MKKRVFVIDDERDIREILRVNLTEAQYLVHSFGSAEEALAELRRTRPDIIVLDIMMNGMDGYEFCRTLRGMREFSTIPVIFLSARAEELDRILGLELGGDDYMTKPFSVKELLSRIKAVLRRAEAGPERGSGRVITYRGVEVRPESYSAKVDGEEIRLTKTEFDILYLFVSHPGKIFSRDNIIDSVKGDNVFVSDRTIDVHIMNLRRKLGEAHPIISTFSGVGYGCKE